MRSKALACIVLGVLSVGALGACQPLYGGKPEKLAPPPKKKAPPPIVAAPIEIKYIDDCQASFREDPKKGPRPDRTLGNKLTDDGDAAVAAGQKMKDPIAGANAIKDAIDKYSNALRKDPYSATTTLKLAVAYDMVYRKGCALAMLKRLQSLSTNKDVSPDANRIIDSVSDNTSLFKGYRKEAVTAIGR